MLISQIKTALYVRLLALEIAVVLHSKTYSMFAVLQI
jgi:hypothetical protein